MEKEFKEGTTRTTGRDAQRINIAIAYAVASAVRTTLGPKGMDKMLVDDAGNVTITNDGATILKEIKIGHPAGKLIVEVAETQDAEVGDGTTTSVAIAGELLKNSNELLDQKIHASNIIRGYNLSSTKAIEILDTISKNLDKKDLPKISKVSLGSKNAGIGTNNEHVTNIIIDALNKTNYDFKNIILVTKAVGSITDSELIEGLILEEQSKDKLEITNPKILVIDGHLELKKSNVNVQLSSITDLQGIQDQENKMLLKISNNIETSGANIIFCKGHIDDLIQIYLRKKKIFCFDKVTKKNLENISKLSGAVILSNADNIEQSDLGTINQISEKEIANSKHLILYNNNSKIVTLLLRGGSPHVVKEVERAVTDALGSLKSALIENKYVIGGGAVEMELSVKLREYAKTINGREQLAVERFADALEIVPKTLAESSGMNVIDTISDLRKFHSENKNTMGINVFESKISDMEKLGIIEPMKTKRQAILSASEVAQMILRIDDVIASNGSENQ